jgi:LysM repeat protein
MARYRGRHRAPSTTGRNLARTAIAGAVIGAPLAAAPVASADTGTGTGTAWDKLAQCESTGNWSINTGNGFSGGLQFTPSTWRAFGGTGAAHHASREEQIVVAERVLAKQGWGAWPACSRKLGLRGTPPPIAKKAPKATPSIAEKVTSTTAKKAAPTGGGSTVTVKPGDTLAKIAAANGAGGWKQLHALNPDLDNPNVLTVGQIIKLAR